MGFLTGGPFYDMIGRTGNNVGRRVKGKNVLSMRPAKSEKAPTARQLDQRLKFGVFTSWLRKALPIVDIGYRNYEASMSAYNKAVSENVRYAVTGVSPNFGINYSMARFSKGVLRELSDYVVTAAADAVLEYSWVNVEGQSYSLGTDQVAVVVYNPTLDEFVVMTNAALRSAEGYDLQLPLDWGGHEVHSWLIAVSAASKHVSDTSYVGMINVVA